MPLMGILQPDPPPSADPQQPQDSPGQSAQPSRPLQPPAAVDWSKTDPTSVPMFDPRGQVRLIPYARAQELLHDGGKFALPMRDPSGNVRMVPHDQYTDLLKAGGTRADMPAAYTPPLNAGESGAVGSFFGRLWQGVKSIPHALNPAVTPEDIAQGVPTVAPVPGIPNIMPVNRLMHSLIQGEMKAGAQFSQMAHSAQFMRDDSGNIIYTPDGIPIPATGEDVNQIVKGGITAAAMTNPFAVSSVANVNELQSQGKGRTAAAEGLADAALLAGSTVAPKVIAPMAKAGVRTLTAPLRATLSAAPRVVTVEGVNIPVLIGEAEEGAGATTWLGRQQLKWKAEGFAPNQFKRVVDAQQAGVRQVITKIAGDIAGEGAETAGPETSAAAAEHIQQTGASGAMPGAPLRSAAVVNTLTKTMPMYSALDASLTSVPGAMSRIGDIVQATLRRASKLGVRDIPEEITGPEPDPATVRLEKTYQDALAEYRLTPGSPGAVQLRESMGLPEQSALDAGGAKQMPMQSYMLARTKLMAASRDPLITTAAKNAMIKAANDMDISIEQTISKAGNPELLANWRAANDVFTRFQAIKLTADAIDKATKGTPVSAQSPEVTAAPPTISGRSLVSQLNDLNSSGLLDRAFNPAQRQALRTVADVLDRAQGTSLGRGQSLMARTMATRMEGFIKHWTYNLIRRGGANVMARILTNTENAQLYNNIAAMADKNPELAAAAQAQVGQAIGRKLTAAGRPIDVLLDKMKRLDKNLGLPEDTSAAGPSAPAAPGTLTGPISTVTPSTTRTLPSGSVMEAAPVINGTDLTLRGQHGNSIGSVALRNAPDVNGQSAMYVQDIRVDPTQHHLGYGQALYEQAARHAADEGHGYLVSSGQPNTAATMAWRQLQARYPAQITHTGTQWEWDLSRLPGPSEAAGTAPAVSGMQMSVPRSPQVPVATPSMSQAARSAAAIAVMSAFKSGEITQQEARDRIRKLTGTDSRKTIAMPRPPGVAAQ